MPWFYGGGRGFPYWWRIDWAGKWGRPRAAMRCPQCGQRMIAGIVQYECPGCGHVVPKPTTHLEHHVSPPDSTTERVKEPLYSKLGRVPGGAHFASFELPRQMNSERAALFTFALLPVLVDYLWVRWYWFHIGYGLVPNAPFNPSLTPMFVYAGWAFLFMFTVYSTLITLREIMSLLSIAVALALGLVAYYVWAHSSSFFLPGANGVAGLQAMLAVLPLGPLWAATFFWREANLLSG